MVDYNPDAERTRWRMLLEAAQDELVDAINQRQALNYKIDSLQRDIVHLAGLCGVQVVNPIQEMGLTDAVRYILASSGDKLKIPLTPIEIRNRMAEKGYDLSDYTNIMASIHTVLRRLQKKKQIMPSQYKEGSYIWVGGPLVPPPPPPSWLKRE